MSARIRNYIRTYALILLASVIFGISFDCFFAPNQISLAGITGVGQIINHYIPAIPIGVAVIILNVPLFLLGWKLLGGHVLISSAIAMFLTSIMVDIVNAVYTFSPMDPMLACVFGGVTLGISVGMVLQQKATTGGTDLIARLLKLKFKHLPMGTLLMAVDLVVIAAVAIVFRSIYSAMYGLIALWISSTVIDKVLYGMDTSKVAYIISGQSNRIFPVIGEKLHRGVTILHGAGSYSGQPCDVLMCAFKQKQIVDLKETVKEIDPDAFLIVCDAHDVLGQGFHFYDPNGV